MSTPDPPDRPRDPDAPAPDFLAARTVKRELLEELRASWAAGAPVPPEQLLARWPGPPGEADAASLLFEDYLQRQRYAEAGSTERHSVSAPQQTDALAGLIREHELIRSAGGSASGERGLRLPGLGDELF